MHSTHIFLPILALFSSLTAALPNPVLSDVNYAEDASKTPRALELSTREPPSNRSLIKPFPFDESSADNLASVFDAIESIPDDLFDEGDDAVKNWLKAHGFTLPTPQKRSPTITSADSGSEIANPVTLAARQTWWVISNCIIQIGILIAENGIPLARLRRIKELIGLLGGARQVAKMLLKAKSMKELYAIGGPYLQDIAEELLGFGVVAKACFSWL